MEEAVIGQKSYPASFQGGFCKEGEAPSKNEK
jgi:hypothetical protein